MFLMIFLKTLATHVHNHYFTELLRKITNICLLQRNMIKFKQCMDFFRYF